MRLNTDRYVFFFRYCSNECKCLDEVRVNKCSKKYSKFDPHCITFAYYTSSLQELMIGSDLIRLKFKKYFLKQNKNDHCNRSKSALCF